MKLSTRARYALRMMVEISRQATEDSPALSLKEIAETMDVSRRYLEQLAIALKNAVLVRGKQGKGGGYRLARPAGDILVGEIIEASIGPINIVDCVLEPGACDKSDECGCRSIYCDINARIADTLNDLTLEDLAEKDKFEKKKKEAGILNGSQIRP
jgi:Rrf2 family iron-sulfur cluster assembly transcriptional regulator